MLSPDMGRLAGHGVGFIAVVLYLAGGQLAGSAKVKSNSRLCGFVAFNVLAGKLFLSSGSGRKTPVVGRAGAWRCFRDFLCVFLLALGRAGDVRGPLRIDVGSVSAVCILGKDGRCCCLDYIWGSSCPFGPIFRVFANGFSVAFTINTQRAFYGI